MLIISLTTFGQQALNRALDHLPNSVFGLQEYIHRVGRTARGNEGRGHALLLLLPEELAFLRYLKQAKVNCLNVVIACVAGVKRGGGGRGKGRKTRDWGLPPARFFFLVLYNINYHYTVYIPVVISILNTGVRRDV